MKPPHELDERGWWLRRWVLMTWRDIISNVLWILLFNGLDEAILRRVADESEGGRLGCCVEDPEVLSQSSHIGPDRDDPSPMSLRLMADGEGDEVGKVEDVPTTKPKLDRFRIVEVGHDGLKIERRIEFQCELEIRWFDDLKEEPPWVSRQEGSDHPSQCNGPHLGVEPVISDIIPPGVPREPGGTGA
ncbi:hypothetical protein GOBAR_AA11642 [Gossypium barbadense]|uniref:Uncharacterized protein n=1 Tax=Gossypium barbadense TaxID=3634 RepID=A0A2P5Y076_GOSBA|nr:hypothetical protein GOBAR_AA11642 [Gossypium barbadense]